jgi:hypothetical protein
MYFKRHAQHTSGTIVWSFWRRRKFLVISQTPDADAQNHEYELCNGQLIKFQSHSSVYWRHRRRGMILQIERFEAFEMSPKRALICSESGGENFTIALERRKDRLLVEIR